MKKIVYDILMAYEKHYLRPVQGAWGTGEMGTACGLGALYYHHTGFHAGTLLGSPDIATKVAAELGLSREYVVGFVHGFDGHCYYQPSEDLLKGLMDGRDAWHAAKHFAVYWIHGHQPLTNTRRFLDALVEAIDAWHAEEGGLAAMRALVVAPKPDKEPIAVSTPVRARI